MDGLFQGDAAICAEIGFWRTGAGTRRTAPGRFLVAVMDQEIPDVWDPSKCIGKDEYGISLVESRVGEKQQGARNA